jgi:hypothetical protein
MAVRGPNFTYYTTATDTPPAGVNDLLDGIGADLTSGQMTGSTSAAVTFQIVPNGTAIPGTASAANTSLANNKGWQIPPTTGMAVTGSTVRRIPNGAVLHSNITVRATGLTGNDTATVHWYKRSAAGALTSIGSATNTAPNGSLGTTTNFGADLTVTQNWDFAPGETLYVEHYLTIAQQTVTAGTATYKLATAGVQQINNPNGILYVYSNSQAVAGAGTSIKQAITAGKVALVTGLGVTALGPRAVAVSKVVIGAGISAVRRSVGLPRAAAGAGLAILGPRTVGLSARLASGAGSFSAIYKVILTAKVATGTGVVTATRTVTAHRAFAVLGSGIPGFARAIISARSFAVSAVGAVKARLDMDSVVFNRASGFDWPLNAPLKHISGVIRNSDGTVFTGGATVALVRTSDGRTVATTTSDLTTGAYSFARGGDDPNTYQVTAGETSTTPTQHGATDSGLTPT